MVFCRYWRDGSNSTPAVHSTAHSYYQPGQYTDFGGIEAQRAGGIFFCGEHTTQDFQGFMEGGASTGKQAAKDLIAHLA